MLVVVQLHFHSGGADDESYHRKRKNRGTTTQVVTTKDRGCFRRTGKESNYSVAGSGRIVTVAAYAKREEQYDLRNYLKELEQ